MLKKVEIGSLTFNDNSNYFVNGFSGLEMPPTRVASYDLAGENFGRFVSSFYGKRRWSLDGAVVGSSQSDLIDKRDALQSALDAINGEITVKFTLANDRAVQIDAVLVSLSFAPRPGVINAADFQVQFESAYPFLLAQVEKSHVISLATGGGGTVPPPTMPMELSFGQGGSVVAGNDGNAICHPTVRINGPVATPALKNATTGKELQFNITLLSGEYLDVDFKAKTIVDNQGVNRYSAKSGEWWYLNPGSNTVQFVANTYDASALVNFYWRPAWLGL
jgi:hypothetical protein